MKSEATCPVCGLDPVPGDPDACPQCDADLTCFKVLDALREPGAEPEVEPEVESGAEPEAAPPPSAPAPRETGPDLPGAGGRRSRRPWLSAALLGGVAVLLLGMMFHRIITLESRLAEQRAALHTALSGIESRLADISERRDGPAETHSRLESRLAEISKNQEKLLEIRERMEARLDASGEKSGAGPSTAMRPDALPPDPDRGPTSAGESTAEQPNHAEAPGSPPDAEHLPAGRDVDPPRGPAAPLFEFHQAGENDTLWRIARRFYGSGAYYPVLLEHNPDLKIYGIRKGDRVAIVKNAEGVEELHRRITEIDGDRLYWFYTVKPGDSIRSIRSRYCPSRRCVEAVAGSDPGATPRPGEKIRIQLSGAMK